jgi:glutathione S-transferase
MSYTLITANRNYSSWSLRPWLLMTMLGIKFDDRLEPFTKPANYDEFRAFSPTGQVPTLIHGERTIWDSLGIALYLADRHDGVWPTDEAAKAWAMCAATEMHGGFSALRNYCTMNVGVRVQPKPMSDVLKRDVARLAELWAQGIDSFGGPFLAGSKFTAVDAFFAPVVFRVRTYGLDVGRAGQLWVDHMLMLPAMLAWEKDALTESWREVGHEEELRGCGEVIADFRTG